MPHHNTFIRILRYLVTRALSLFLAVVVSVLLTILVANNSGVLESELKGSRIQGWFSGVLDMRTRPPGSDVEVYHGTFVETIDLLINGLTLNLGETALVYQYGTTGVITEINDLILQFLVRTLLLFGLANFLLFFLSIALALALYRSYGSFLDRLVVTLSPLSSVPAWIYGVVLVVFSARVLHFYPTGILDQLPTELNWSTAIYVAKRLLLPILAVFLSKIFQSIYVWRTFFLVHASEDYVEMGKAQGISKKKLDRQYVIRPALPSLLTNFTVMLTSIWQEAIIIELFFGVAGIGHLFYNALKRSATEMPLLVGLTVTFAYLLALSVFLLDIAYALVDPRVRIDGQSEASWQQHRPSLKERLQRLLAAFKRREPAYPALHRRGTRFKDGSAGALPLKTSWWEHLKHSLQGLGSLAKEFSRFPSAVVGLLILLVMLGVSIYTPIAYPYRQVISEWLSTGEIWRDNPKDAAPIWTNWFRTAKLAESQTLSTAEGTASKVVGETVNDMTPVQMEFVFDYNYDEFPTEINLHLATTAREKKIFIASTWIRPDGSEINIGNLSTQAASEYMQLLVLKGLVLDPNAVLPKHRWFGVEGSDPPVVLKGRYVLRLEAFIFEPDVDIDATVIMHGQLYGWAGTDSRRRDLLVPLLWGTPIALAFGLGGALLASLATMTLAAIGVWFGGWVDALIQRLTEVNMVLPSFPLLVLVYVSISKNIWVILGLAVLLNMMNNAIKNYRAFFLQIREAGYIEAARTYGASDWRIIFLYLAPRIAPVLAPQMVSLAPGLVFLEATLAYLNISDPLLPTWGKLIQESLSSGALNGAYYQVLEPIGLLLITGLALSMIGFALDRILNPRLRES